MLMRTKRGGGATIWEVSSSQTDSWPAASSGCSVGKDWIAHVSPAKLMKQLYQYFTYHYNIISIRKKQTSAVCTLRYQGDTQTLVWTSSLLSGHPACCKGKFTHQE